MKSKVSLAVLLSLLMCSNFSNAATILGPTAYLSSTDSPFSALLGSAGFYLENFEDNAVNTLGLQITGGQILGPSSLTDSVDADDGVIDGSGRGGRSYWSNFANLTINFSSQLLGSLPTHVGLVITHSTGSPSYSFFDGNGDLITSFTTVVPSSPNGETSNDRFFGVISDNGVSRIETTTNLELDHIQYGTVPVPAALWLLAPALGGLGLMRRKAA